MKKTVSFLLVCLLLLVYPVYNLLFVINPAEKSQTQTDEGISILNSLSANDVQAVEKNINDILQKRNLLLGANQKDIKKALKALDKGKTTYRKLFKNVYIVGDSLMNGLEIYNILNSNHLITQVSANFTHLSENTEKIIGLNPPVLILHYGINMIGTTENHKKSFISNYTKHIRKLKKELPGTRIIISGLFPVDRSIATAERFKNIGAYNKALKKMCEKLDVEFLNSSSVLKAHPECYGIDGIHLSKTFYDKYWLRFIIEEKGIVG
ncbi:MAG: hypothetical protein IJ491_01470 [Clostridia bacterium]|nr:hypothetical protein [Clostridia bacterium]